MNYEISNHAFAPIVNIKLGLNEKIKIERGSMVYKNSDVAIEGNLNGKGFFKSLGRALTSGESMFITTATSSSENGLIGIAPSIPGEIKGIECGKNQWFLNDGSYLASSESVSYEMIRKSRTGTALVGGTGGFYNMKTNGEGIVLISGFGNIIEYDLNGGEEFIVDNSHVLAWSTELTYSTEIASGAFGFTTGEGFVLKFKGTGKLYIQTRQLASLADNIARYLPSNK